MQIEKIKKTRADGQISGLAGEFFVAGELLKRGIQVAVTFGNAKAIDLFACNPRTNKTFTIQVKALRTTNCFPISHTKVHSDHVYVFVLLNKPGTPVEYFIVPGFELKEHPEAFGKGFLDTKFPAIFPKELVKYREKWTHFDIV